MCLGFIVKRFFPFIEAEKSLKEAGVAFKAYNDSGAKDDLLQAIGHYRRAYETSDQPHKQFSAIVMNYAAALDEYDVVFGKISDHPEVITLLNKAREAMQKQSPRPENYPHVLNNLGTAYLSRYRKTKRNDFQSAIEMFRSVSSSDLSAKWSSLIGSATAIWTACELEPQDDDIPLLKQAIDYLEQAHQLQPDNEIEYFRHLASVHDLLHRKTHDREDLNKAIQYNTKAVSLLESNPGTSNLAATVVFNLAKQQFERHTATKNAKDLADAQDNASKAVAQSKELTDQVNKLRENIERYERRGSTTLDSIGSSRVAALRQGSDGETALYEDQAQRRFFIGPSHPYANEPDPLDKVPGK
jgi:tetratricopeptide (TPR) repeat protein